MKKLLSMMVGLAAGIAFGVEVPAVQVVTFSTQGDETYADGTPIADGECYALVWSANETFGGIDANGNAKVAGDQVLYIGTFAKGGCQTVVFQIADGYKGITGGYFDLWLLDTRVFENGAVKSIGKAANGSVIVTHAAKAIEASVKVASGVAPATVGGIGAVVAGPTVDLAGIQPPTITQFKVDGDYVVLEMANVMPGVNYSAVGANTPGFDNPSEGKTSTATGDKITVIMPKTGDKGFFKGITK